MEREYALWETGEADDQTALLDERAAEAEAADEEFDFESYACWLSYRRLGGTRSEAEYLRDLQRFYEYTLESFVLGKGTTKLTRPDGREVAFSDKRKAADYFTQDVLGGDAEEWQRFFVSVDATTGGLLSA